ncbi:unnamed protein product [Cunninghamella blakesleeana]
MKISFAIGALVTVLGLVDAKTFLFPIPQEVNWTGKAATLSSDFQIIGATNTHVKEAAKRYQKLIRKERWEPVQVPYEKEKPLKKASKQITHLRLHVKDNHAKLDMGVDESYELRATGESNIAILTSNTWVGALRGLETFSQLVTTDPKNDHQLIVHGATIEDSPSYGHRGISLDTSRNYLSVKDIFRTIDAMSYNKMNVLHWHATDSQSWPLVFKSHPELSKNGAYSSKEIYSPKDVQTILKYAESRGVRVILELDMPAHTASIGESHPDVMACLYDWWGPLAAEPPAGQLNPLSKKGNQLVRELIKEATSIFPDSLYHTGGDEINAKCWTDNKEIAAYLKKHDQTAFELWADWSRDLFDFVKTKTKKRPIVWEDPLREGGKFDKDLIVQSWIAPPSNYTSLGHDVIVSNADYFYLDCGHGGWVGEDERYISPEQKETPTDTFNYGGVGGSWCAPYKTWQRIYSFDLTHGVKDTPGKVLGVELALWAEQSGPTVLDSKLWPRSAAAAEITWSGSYDKDGKRRTVNGDVMARFSDWVYHLQARGIGAAPIQPKFCAKHPHACDLNEPKK